MGVFVANRGEIAVRIVRAAREAGLEAVVAVTRAEADGLAAPGFANLEIPAPQGQDPAQLSPDSITS